MKEEGGREKEKEKRRRKIQRRMERDVFELEGNIVDVVAGRVFPGKVTIAGGRIREFSEQDVDSGRYILPGLIDAHIHVESSMLIPSEFARLAVVHGTIGSVSDPHEIANVLGIPGVLFMISNGNKTPFKFCFGAPSCVPATSFETAGSALGVEEIRDLLARKEIRYLSEMMNFPGVLASDPEILAKLSAAGKAKKPVDGHAPGLRGEEVRRYAEAGITTDHECFTREEALDKLHYGMKILIREGSAAKNFEALCGLIPEFPGMVMLCSDDKHPDDLARGHINDLVRRSLGKGYDLVQTLRTCTVNPVKHYGLDIGLLQQNDPADLIIVDSLDSFAVRETYINGRKVAENGRSLLQTVSEEPANNFKTGLVSASQLKIAAGAGKVRVMVALDGQLITREEVEAPLLAGDFVVADPGRDLLKIVVKCRYRESKPAVGFVKGFGLKRGAIASCVAHDSHNLVAVGTDDDSLACALNLIIREGGGISRVDGTEEEILPLPFAGIMSGQDGYQVARAYEGMTNRVRSMGSRLQAPYMTLSFMALLVIPELKLSDRGLFDGRKFAFTPLLF
jgi:adenine deaminase